MARLDLIPARRASRELREAYRYVNGRWRMMGAPAVAIQISAALSHRPGLLRAVGDGYYYAGWCGTLPRTVRELVAVLVSRENDCFY
jgi:alkylhydroperoxidase family enzyme